MATRRTAAEEPKPTAEELATGSISKIDPRDEVLNQYRSFTGSGSRQDTPAHDLHMRVGNVPTERVVTWVTDPRIDNGRAIAIWRSLGFRLVEMDEVSNDPNIDEKLFCRYFEEGPNKSVAMGGGVLMIGYRQYREERKESERNAARAQVAQQQEKMDSMGIRHGGQISRGGLTEV